MDPNESQNNIEENKTNNDSNIFQQNTARKRKFDSEDNSKLKNEPENLKSQKYMPYKEKSQIE